MEIFFVTICSGTAAYCGSWFALQHYHKAMLLPALKLLSSVQSLPPSEPIVPVIASADAAPVSVAPRKPLSELELKDVMLKLHGSC